MTSHAGARRVFSVYGAFMNHDDSHHSASARHYPGTAARPSFRKRRPRLFLLAFVVGILCIVWAGNAFFEYADRTGLFSGPRLGVLRVEGPIASSQAAVDWADRLRDDDTIAGVLLRMDSPGGAVAPAQEIYTAVKRLAEKKPVVVSMGSAGASGGYYIAVAGHEIFANPSTITGSIGVRLDLVNAEGLAALLGIRPVSLTTGALKNAGSPFHTMTEEERAYLQQLIDDMQEQFVTVVAENREMDLETVRRLADGRAYTGNQALRLGLVDTLGDSGAALERLAALAGVPVRGTKLVEAPEPERPFWRRLAGILLGLDDIRSTLLPGYTFYY